MQCTVRITWGQCIRQQRHLPLPWPSCRRSIRGTLTGMHQNGVRDLTITPGSFSFGFSEGTNILHSAATSLRLQTQRAHMVSLVCRWRTHLVRCARTPRPNLLAAIADGLPILLVDRTRRQLSRPPQDRRRRRGARGARATLSSLFLTIVWLCSARRCCSNTAPPSPRCRQQLSFQP